MSLMQVHQSTAVVAGRAGCFVVNFLDLPGRCPKLLRDQLEGDLLGAQWHEC